MKGVLINSKRPLVFYLFILALLVYADIAQAVKFLPKGIKYTETLNAESTPDIRAIDDLFEKAGYGQMNFEGQASPLYAIDWLNRIYFVPQSNANVMLKANVTVTRPIVDYEVYNAGSRFIVHVPSVGSKHHALYFSEFELSRVEKWVLKLKSISDKKNLIEGPGSKKAPAYGWPSLFISQAFAEEAPTLSICKTKDTVESVKDVAAAVALPKPNCLKGALFGVWNATGGSALEAVDGFVDGVKQFATDPIAFGNAVAADWARFKNFIFNFPKVIGEFGSDFKRLPPEVQNQLLCELVGTLGGSLFVITFSGGSGSAVVINAFKTAVLKMSKLFPSPALLRLAAKVAIVGKTLTTLPNAVLALAQLEKRALEISDEIVKALKNYRQLKAEINTLRLAHRMSEAIAVENEMRTTRALVQNLRSELNKLEPALAHQQSKVRELNLAVPKPVKIIKEAVEKTTLIGLCTTFADIRSYIDRMEKATIGTDFKPSSPKPAPAVR